MMLIGKLTKEHLHEQQLIADDTFQLPTLLLESTDLSTFKSRRHNNDKK